jgi:hypothetical protein
VVSGRSGCNSLRKTEIPTRVRSQRGDLLDARFRGDDRTRPRDNVTDQLLNPVGGMPSFGSKLEAEETQKLLAYLETLWGNSCDAVLKTECLLTNAGLHAIPSEAI